MTLPAALAGAIVWFVLRYVIGAAAYIPGAAAASAVLLVETIVVTELLGPVYERLDSLSVERAE